MWIRLSWLLAILGLSPEAVASSEMARVLQRPIRSISFPANSNMGIYLALAVPLNEPLNTISLSYFFEANYVLPVNYSLDDARTAFHASRSNDNGNTTTTAGPASISEKLEETDNAGTERRRRSIDRSTFYAVISSKFESAGFPGHECLLRSICEASEHPLEHNGILGDIFHVVFTPSSSRAEDQLPDGIIEAELKGRNGTCYHYRSLCPLGLFDLIGILL